MRCNRTPIHAPVDLQNSQHQFLLHQTKATAIAMSRPLNHPEQVDILCEVIENRRSIKPSEFSKQCVCDSIVLQMLQNANWAPTHGMTEPWRFFVYTNDAKNQLGQKLADIYKQITPLDDYKESKAQKLISNAMRSSHLIVIAMKRQESGKIPEIEEIEAVACSVQNLHLTATAHGVGGYWSSGKAICSDELRDHLHLGKQDRILGLFYLGYPEGDWPKGKRTPAENRIVWQSTSPEV